MNNARLKQDTKRTFTKRAAAILIAIAAYSGCQTNALADIGYITTSGFSITNTSASRAPVTAVYSNFIQHIDRWWPKEHTWWKGTLRIDELAGGCFCETKGAKSAAHMQIVYIDPNKKVVMTGGLGPLQEMGVYGTLTWLFTKTDLGTKITLTYHASGPIQFNGVLSTAEEVTDLVTVIDTVQTLQLNALTTYSDET